ncbi:MAG: DUF1858 domain-containing protein [Bacteroidota bacterium]
MPLDLNKDTAILAILSAHPETRAVFASLGMGCLDCLGAGSETVETGARMHGLSVEQVLTALRNAIEREKAP